VRYREQAARRRPLIGTQAFDARHSPDGKPWIVFYRQGSDYLVRFPGLADFAIAADGRDVRCRPEAGVAGDTLEHLYNNQVLPLALSQQGRLVLHGSAVEADGGALAFVGVSGRGKSTLAASFSRAGHRLLTDDRLEIETGGRDIRARPGQPSMRLWDDSREALIGANVPAAPPVQGSPKTRILAGGGLVFCTEPRPLRGVYFLGEGAVEDAAIRQLGAREALIELARNAFLLDAEARDLVTAHFERLSRMARVPIHHRLDYPRRFDALGSVRRAILDHVRSRREAPSARSRSG
jgi:hypothetical protein